MSFVDDFFVGIEQYHPDYPFGTPSPFIPPVPPPPVIVQRGKVKELIPWMYDYDFEFYCVEPIVISMVQQFKQKIRCVIPSTMNFVDISSNLIINNAYKFQEIVELITIPTKCQFEETINIVIDTAINFEEISPIVISTQKMFSQSFPLKIKVLSEREAAKRLLKFLDKL